jgi:hypothetical protein
VRGINRKIKTSFVLLTLIAGSSASAKWMAGTQMPVSRLLKNVAEYVQKHPKDANGYYTLARIQSAAFAVKAEALSLYPEPDLPFFGPSSPRINTPRSGATVSDAEAAIYADSLHNYRRSVELNPGEPLHWFGYGFQLEEALKYPQTTKAAAAELKLELPLNSPQLRESIRTVALANYRQAYTLALPHDKSARSASVFSVSEEAYLSIARLQQGRRLSDAESSELATMKATVAEMKSQPRFITPIVIRTDPSARPEMVAWNAMDANRHRVQFDMLGTGKASAWTWIKPETGLLVWDPHHTKSINNGQQLFGTTTWWLFWKDGYEPLKALDNNGDGWLTGSELNGIAVWFDKNGNGICDAGEVVSLRQLGITKISVRANAQYLGQPFNQTGVVFADGHTALTMDWKPSSDLSVFKRPHLIGR